MLVSLHISITKKTKKKESQLNKDIIDILVEILQKVKLDKTTMKLFENLYSDYLESNGTIIKFEINWTSFG